MWGKVPGCETASVGAALPSSRVLECRFFRFGSRSRCLLSRKPTRDRALNLGEAKELLKARAAAEPVGSGWSHGFCLRPSERSQAQRTCLRRVFLSSCKRFQDFQKTLGNIHKQGSCIRTDGEP